VAEPLLAVRDLSVDYVTPEGPVRAVDGVSLDVARGEVVGVAGESACGKSTLAQALLRILPPPAVISAGEVRFEGQDLLALGEAELRRVRWRRISMVFQGALDALNPVVTVGEQLCDAIRAHEPVSAARARERAAALLDRVAIGADRLGAFPHQLSGGMRQRVAIAMALALDPALVVLDEPTTALDVILEREILHGLLALRRAHGFSVLFITHDLARMLEVSDRVAVLYAARLVEIAPAAALRAGPRHPYTQGLLRAFPSLRGEELPASIPGAPPGLRRPPAGCRFHPRCERADALCRERAPALVPLGGGHAVACHHAA
jgi:peptide/nickel transport system ATP-binding protein